MPSRGGLLINKLREMMCVENQPASFCILRSAKMASMILTADLPEHQNTRYGIVYVVM